MQSVPTNTYETDKIKQVSNSEAKKSIKEQKKYQRTITEEQKQ